MPAKRSRQVVEGAAACLGRCSMDARELVGGDADGQRLQPRGSALRRAPGPSGWARPSRRRRRGPEVLQVGVGLEGEEVRAQQAAQHLVPPGQDAEHLGGGERDVEEEADRAPRARPRGAAAAAASGGSRGPRPVSPGCEVLEHGVAEAAVGRHVGRPASRVELEVASGSCGRAARASGWRSPRRSAGPRRRAGRRRRSRGSPATPRRAASRSASGPRGPWPGQPIQRPPAVLHDGVQGAGQAARAALGPPGVAGLADRERAAGSRRR